MNEPNSPFRVDSFLFAAGAVAIACILSVLFTPYRFAAGDDAWQIPMVLHEVDRGLLTRDALTTEVVAQYKSVFLPALGVLARHLQLPQAYLSIFIISRIALMVAFYQLALVITRHRPTAVLAVLLLPAYGAVTGPGYYFGAIPLIEEKLVPRTAALPFAIWTIAAMIQSRPKWVAVCLAATFVLHPVTGVNLFGIYVVYTVLVGRTALTRGFGAVVIGACAVMGLAALWGLGRPPEGSPLIIDGTWLRIVADTSAPFIYILSDTGWTPSRIPMVILIYAVSMSALSDRNVAAILLRLALAVTSACVVHLITVDWLSVRTLTLVSPQRSFVVTTVLAGIGLACVIVQVWRSPHVADRCIAALLAACILLRVDYRVLATMLIIAGAQAWRRRASTPRAPQLPFAPLIACLVAVAVCLGLVPRPSESILAQLGRSFAGQEGSRGVRAVVGGSTPRTRRALHQLARLGEMNPDKRSVQAWIRDHSAATDIIEPPIPAGLRKLNIPADLRRLNGARGWQIYSQRACTFNASLHTFTYLSPQFANRYEALLDRIGLIPQPRRWHHLVDFARQGHADWLLIDERTDPRQLADPEPAFSSGPYSVLRIGNALP